MFGFGDNDVVIPIYVIEEIDQFKRDLSSLGRNARQVSRYLDEFRALGHLRDGVPLGPDKGTVRVLISQRRLPPELGDGHTTDNRILATALDVRERQQDVPVVFVTKDVNLRVRADALGLHAEDYDVEEVNLDELWKGIVEVDVEPQAVNDFYTNGSVAVPVG